MRHASILASLFLFLAACGGDTIVINAPTDAGGDASADAVDGAEPDVAEPDASDAAEPDVADAAEPDASDVAEPDALDAAGDVDVDTLLDAPTDAPTDVEDADDTTGDATSDGDTTVEPDADALNPDAEVGDVDAIGPDVDASDVAMDAGDADVSDTSDALDTGDTDPDSGDTDTDAGPADPLVTFCADIPRSPRGCDATVGTDGWLFVGDVLLADQRLIGGQVAVNTLGEVTCAACDCGDALTGLSPSILSCGGQAISPGLINAHDHITYGQLAPADIGTVRYDHRHQWREGFDELPRISAERGGAPSQVSLAEIRQLAAGTTSIAGSGGRPGLIRNLDRDETELGTGSFEYETFPLGDADGERLSSTCDYPDLPTPTTDTCFHAHVAEGVSQAAYNEFVCLSGPDGVDVTEPNAAFVHMIAADALAGAALAANGTSHIWSPRSNLALYGHTAPVTMFQQQGVRIALGTDWVVTGSANILRELACADAYNADYLDAAFTDRELWLMTTAWSADAMNIANVVGQIREGALADISVFAVEEGQDPYRAILEASEDDVLAVFIGGEPMLVDAAFAGVLAGALLGCEATTICGATKHLCVERELGQTLGSLTASALFDYPVFACEAPANEPTCVPSRPGEYTGAASASDLDGDGVPNEADNCPRVFNAVRPVDGETQPDADGDGVGDACDVCPLDAFAEICSFVDVDDLDGDGVNDLTDNCRGVSNPLQVDTDDDDVGDSCDECPEFADSSGACPVSIYALKQAEVPNRSVVAAEGTVTGVGPRGFFMQVADVDRSATLGAAFSGIYVHIGGEPGVVQGDRASVTATYEDFFGQPQLNSVTRLEIRGVGAAVSATDVSVAEAVTSGAAWEGVVVTTIGEVTSYDPPAGDGDVNPNNEYVLDGLLRVNDFLRPGATRPALGSRVSVTGPLRFGNGDYKIEPRSELDVQVVGGLTPRLIAVTPDLARVPLGSTSGSVATPSPWRVLLDEPAGPGGVTVELTADAGAGLTVAASVTLLEGEITGNIPFTTLVSNGAIGTLTATLGADVRRSEFHVYDPADPPEILRVTPDPLVIPTGATGALTVELSQRATNASQAFELSTGRAVLSGATTAPIGATSVSLDVTAVAGASIGSEVLNYGLLSVYEFLLDITAAPTEGLRLHQLFVNPAGADDGLEWVQLENGSGVSVDLSAYALGWGGVDYTYGTMALSGVLDAGECIIIGGPTSSDANGNPVFGLVQTFSPNMQNSGTTADGVALFDVPAATITGVTVPIDSVVYGTNNVSGLLQTSGASVPDAGVPNSGQALIRTSTGAWQLSDPNPTACGGLPGG